MLVVCNDGSLRLLEIVRASFNLHPVRVGLYQNDLLPTLLSTVADFTPCSFPGYVSQLLNWPDAASVDPSGHGVIEASTVTWKVTADVSPRQRVYGYFVTTGSGTDLLWAERFPSRVWLQCANELLGLRCRFGGLSEFSG